MTVPVAMVVIDESDRRAGAVLVPMPMAVTMSVLVMVVAHAEVPVCDWAAHLFST
jgi:hypothetical protein